MLVTLSDAAVVESVRRLPTVRPFFDSSRTAFILLSATCEACSFNVACSVKFRLNLLIRKRVTKETMIASVQTNSAPYGSLWGMAKSGLKTVKKSQNHMVLDATVNTTICRRFREIS